MHNPSHHFITDIISALHTTQSSVQIAVPLPMSPLKTEQWVNQFTSHFSFQPSQPDWGADRYQVVLTSADQGPSTSDKKAFQCLLCIEWLCEAIWLEPIGNEHVGMTQNPGFISDYLKQQAALV